MTVVEKQVLTAKKEVVEEITEKVKASSIVILSEYRGLTVGDMTSLRAALRENGAEAKVYKNTLTRIALDGLKIGYPTEMLTGPNLFVNSSDDVAKISKVLVNFNKQNQNLNIKGGVLDSQLLDLKDIQDLAKLPSREVLIAKTVGLIKAPLSGLVSRLSSPQAGFVNVLKSIQTKKSEE